MKYNKSKKTIVISFSPLLKKLNYKVKQVTPYLNPTPTTTLKYA